MRRYRPSSRAQEIQSAIWLIGLGILFFTGRWWPGILIVIGVSAIAGAVVRGLDAGEAPPPPPPAFGPLPPAPPPPAPAPAVIRPIVTQAAPPRARRLPDICPNCGAPPRSLPQRGDNPNACPYCGADLSLGLE